MVNFLSNFLRNCQFSKVAVPYLFLPAVYEQYQLLHSIANPWYLLVLSFWHSHFVAWYLLVVLISISLMTVDVEHIFKYLLAICVSFMKCLFKSFTHLKKMTLFSYY